MNGYKKKTAIFVLSAISAAVLIACGGGGGGGGSETASQSTSLSGVAATGAAMADAAEHYLRLKTAARLLTWSIEKFRETQQASGQQ